MAEDILRIGAEFDVGPIVAGAQQAVTAFDRLAAATVKNAQAHSELTAATTLAKTAGVDEALGLQILAEAQQRAAIAAAELADAQKAVASASGQATMGIHETRLATDLLTGNVTRAETSLIRMAGSFGPIGGLIQAAFPVFIAVAFISILDTMYEKIVDMSSAWAGWDKAAQAAYADAIKANQEWVDFLAKTEIEKLKIPLIGLEGMAKYRGELSNSGKELAILNEQMVRYSKLAQDAQSKRDVGVTSIIPAELTESGQAVTITKIPSVGSKEWDELTKSIGESEKKVEDYKKQIYDLQNVKLPTLEAGEPKIASAEAKKSADEEYRHFEMMNQSQEEAAKGAAEELRQIEEVQRKKEEADRKALEDSYREFDLIQQQQEEITREVKKEIDNREKLQTEQVKNAEKSGLEQVAAEEAAIKETADLQRARVSGSQSPEISKLEALKNINAQELAELEKNAADKYAVELKAAQDKKALDLGGETEPQVQAKAASTGDYSQADKVAADNQKILDAQAVFAAQMAAYKAKEALDAQASATKIQQAYLKAFAPINSAFESFTEQILQGNETVRIAFERMCDSILMSWARMLEQKILLAVEAKAQTEVLIVAEKVITVLAHAAEAAAGAFASQAAIPVVGPEMGVAASAGVYADVAGLISLQKGGILPEDMALYGHAGEMMLPQPISSGIQSVIPAMQKFGSVMNESGGSSSSSGLAPAAGAGDTHLHMNFNTFDQKGLADFLHQPGNRAQFTKAVRTAVRNGTRFH
jgi:hypothetical protein